MDDLLEEFIAETRETLESISNQLILWEKNPQDRDLIDSIFRFVHMVKGSCSFLDIPRLLRLSHAAEDLLSCVRDGTVAASPQLVTAILSVIDHISVLNDALETGQAVYDMDDALIDVIRAFLPSGAVLDTPIMAQQDDAECVFDLEKPDQITNKQRNVRISVAQLDKLMNCVSDLVLARNEVSRHIRQNEMDNAREQAFARLSQSVADIRDSVGSMRMQNIDRLFSPLPRLVRDICAEQDKDVRLTIEGGEVEIDREMVEILRDPLTHILRNAVDHGIETANEREQANKKAQGHIKIFAHQSGNQILVEISDDGRGINLDRLKEKAISANLITSSVWQGMSEKQQLAMIFQPGLSTAENVTTLSGRGVGMDIVHNNIMSIGGSIDIENFERQGLKITLRLPLTLSIISGLSVRAADQTFGISRNSIIEIISGKSAHVVREILGGASIVSIRGERYPSATLESVLGLEISENKHKMSRTLLLIRPAVGAKFVLDVAEVIDSEELVVKPAAPLVMASNLFAGTSLPDSGLPMLLLDASGLAAVIAPHAQKTAIAEPEQLQAIEEESFAGLLYESRNGLRRGIRLSVIERVEEVSRADISEAGGITHLLTEGHLIEIFDYAPQDENKPIKILRLYDGMKHVALCIENVLDLATIGGKLSPSAQPHIYEGATIIDGNVYEIINPYQYFETDFSHARAGIQNAECYIDAAPNAYWEHHILAPLLEASGYQVSFDPSTRDHAALILMNERENDPQKPMADNVICLRETPYAHDLAQSSIYRYDRIGLFSAIDAKLMGKA